MRRINHFILSLYLCISYCYPLGLLNAQNRDDTTETKIIGESVSISNSVEPELFPVIAKLLSEGNEKFVEHSLVKWNIENLSSDTVTVTLSADIPEWVTPAITPALLGPGEKKKVMQNPFGNKLLLTAHSIVPTTIILIAKIDGQIVHEETKNIKIRPANDMIWSMHEPWDMVDLIGAWVTPNDYYVEEILSRAKDRRLNNDLSGYQGDVSAQLKAIFNTVRNDKVSYVDSHMSFGEIGFTQRVRLPKESITQKSANCIDGAVLFASLFENIGLEPLIILIPGHAFVGVKTSLGSDETWFIETTLVGRSMLNSILTLKTTFQAAVEEGARRFNEAMQQDINSVYIIDIKKVRQEGIYPLW